MMRSLLLLLLPTWAMAQPADDRDALLTALGDELARTTKELVLPSHERPYFVGYRLVETDRFGVEARFGALTEDDRQVRRAVAVDVRVGDYTFDSSPEPDDELLFDLEGFRPKNQAPLEDDAASLRGALWLLTDKAYKEALSTFLRKRARKVNTVEDEHVDAFSREPPVVYRDPALAFAPDRAQAVALVRSASARLKGKKTVLDGTVRFSADHVRTFLVNSEGSRVILESVIYSLTFELVGQASDGMLLTQGESLYGRTPEELPTPAALEAKLDLALANLEALAAAPMADPYTGPAILEPEATGVFFHEALGHRLEGERQNDENEGRTFKGQLNTAILPAFISVRDDPTLRTVGAVSLNGYYLVDDQGVKAEKVVLVDGGVLKTFLTSRRPVLGVSRSNGHGRAQGINTPIARMGNLIVEGKAPVSRAKLKDLLLKEVRRQGKPYGLIIRDITGGSTNTSTYGYQAFKGTPRMVYRVDAKTGAETLVRGVEMVGTPLTVVGKVMATSDEVGVFNGFCGAESGFVPVSAVAPASLFQEIELQRTQRAKERPPILPPPWVP